MEEKIEGRQPPQVFGRDAAQGKNEKVQGQRTQHDKKAKRETQQRPTAALVKPTGTPAQDQEGTTQERRQNHDRRIRPQRDQSAVLKEKRLEQKAQWNRQRGTHS